MICPLLCLLEVSCLHAIDLGSIHQIENHLRYPRVRNQFRYIHVKNPPSHLQLKNVLEDPLSHLQVDEDLPNTKNAKGYLGHSVVEDP